MYYVTLKMDGSRQISRALEEMLRDDRRYDIERDQSPALIGCSDMEAAAGLISAVSHAGVRVHAIELTANRPHDLSMAAAGND